MMNRRGFLERVGAALGALGVAGHVGDVQASPRVPDAKPAPPGVAPDVRVLEAHEWPGRARLVMEARDPERRVHRVRVSTRLEGEDWRVRATLNARGDSRRGWLDNDDPAVISVGRDDAGTLTMESEIDMPPEGMLFVCVDMHFDAVDGTQQVASFTQAFDGFIGSQRHVR